MRDHATYPSTFLTYLYCVAQVVSKKSIRTIWIVIPALLRTPFCLLMPEKQRWFWNFEKSQALKERFLRDFGVTTSEPKVLGHVIQLSYKLFAVCVETDFGALSAFITLQGVNCRRGAVGSGSWKNHFHSASSFKTVAGRVGKKGAGSAERREMRNFEIVDEFFHLKWHVLPSWPWPLTLHLYHVQCTVSSMEMCRPHAIWGETSSKVKVLTAQFVAQLAACLPLS